MVLGGYYWVLKNINLEDDLNFKDKKTESPSRSMWSPLRRSEAHYNLYSKVIQWSRFNFSYNVIIMEFKFY